MTESNHFCIKAEHLRKTYSNRNVVSDVSIDINSGEIVGLLGPNGAGKTTTFYIIVGLIKADQGKISLSEQDITLDPIHVRAQKGIGYLPQEPSIFRELTIEENIYSVLEYRPIESSVRKSLLEKLLEDFGLMHIRGSKGQELSGGERRRVEIARTLALDPKFIFLDEPFAGVDPIAVLELKKIIRRLKDKQIGIFITDHNVRETLDIVDRGYIMNNGKLLVTGTPQEIIKNPEAKKFYLGEKFQM